MVPRSIPIIAGAVIGMFFASLAATGLGLLISHAYVSLAYTLTVTAIGTLFAAVSFRMALRALHSKPHHLDTSPDQRVSHDRERRVNAA